ncbi:MAG: DUF6444 domain-containing protein [Longimicrobiaceae bacterium]
MGEVLSPAVRAVILAQEAEITALRARVAELEARLGMNSTNSPRPPSLDPPGTARPAKPRSGRRRGGQQGHPGHHRSLLPPSRVDHLIEHRPAVCRRCGGSLAAGRPVGGPEVHQVIELPPVRAVVTEHRALAIAHSRSRASPKVPVTSQLGHVRSYRSFAISWRITTCGDSGSRGCRTTCRFRDYPARRPRRSRVRCSGSIHAFARASKSDGPAQAG